MLPSTDPVPRLARSAAGVVIAMLVLGAPAAAAQSDDAAAPGLEQLRALEPDPDRRDEQAAWILEELLTSDDDAAAMIQALADPEIGPPTREILAQALGNRARRKEAFVSQLVTASASESELVRLGATRALRQVVRGRPAAVDALIARIADESADVRRQALLSLRAARFVLGETPAATPAVRKALGDEDPAVRLRAWELAPFVLPLDEAVEGLARVYLNDQLAAERVWVLLFAMRPGNVAQATFIGHLVDALNGDDAVLSARAREGLAHLRHRLSGAVSELARRLGDEDVAVRRRAAETLVEIAPWAGGVTPDVVQALGDPDPVVASAASRTLMRIPDDRAVQALLEAMDKGTPDERARARAALARRKPERLPPGSTIEDAIADERNGVRHAALETFEMPRDPEELDRACDLLMASPYDDVRELTLRKLTNLWTTVGFSPAEPLRRSTILPRLVAGTTDPASPVRRVAAEGLYRVRQADDHVVAALCPLLEDPDADTRKFAAFALSFTGTAGAPARARLMTLVDEPDPQVRSAAAMALGAVAPGDPEVAAALVEIEIRPAKELHVLLPALGRLGPASDEIVPTLARALEDPDPTVRLAAIEGLGHLGLADPTVPDLLAGTLDDADRTVRKRGIEALGRLSSADEASGLLLARAFEDDDDGLRRTAISWAGREAGFAPGPAAPVMIPALIELCRSDPFEHIRRAALRAVVDIEPGAERTRDVLIDALDDNAPSVRRRAALELVELGPAAAPAVPALRSRLTDDDVRTARWCARALGQIGTPARDAVPDLIAMLQHPDPGAVMSASAALGNIGSADPSLLPELTALLVAPDPRMAVGGAYALGIMGPAATDALPQLRQASAHADPRIAQVASNAIQKIQGGAAETQPAPE